MAALDGRLATPLEYRGRLFGRLPLQFVLQAAADLPHGLPQAVFVLDQRHPQKTFAGWAETGAWADGDIPFFQQQHGEVDSVHLAEPRLRILGPDEHAR